MLTLKSIGELIAKLVNAVVTTFELKIRKRAEPKQVETKSVVILNILMALLIVVYGLLTMRFKDWTFVEGVYFWFVTLSTIGFGDYHIINLEAQRIQQLPFNSSKYPETDHKSDGLGEISSKLLYSLLGTLPSVFGLCIVASVINAIMAAIEERKWRPRCPGCVPRKAEDHVDTPVQPGVVEMTSFKHGNSWIPK